MDRKLHWRRAVRSVTRRRLIVGILVLLALVTAAFVFVGKPLASIATAYTAKTLCSEVFVAGRHVDDVLADLTIDDLGALRILTATVDTTAGSAPGRLTPLFERRARFRAELGCTLETDGASLTPSSGSWGVSSSLTMHASRQRAPVTTDTVAALVPDARRAIDAVLDDAFSEPDRSRPRHARCGVMQHGTLVAERYAPGLDASTPLAGWSMAKGVLNALVGVAVKEGKLALEAPVRLAAWSAPDDPRGRITVSDLLRMSSGLEFGEGQSDPRSDIMRMLLVPGRMIASWPRSSPH